MACSPRRELCREGTLVGVVDMPDGGKEAQHTG